MAATASITHVRVNELAAVTARCMRAAAMKWSATVTECEKLTATILRGPRMRTAEMQRRATISLRESAIPWTA